MPDPKATCGAALRVAIIGAGPVGLAAALGCLRRGFVPTVLEQANAPGASLRAYGPTRFFTPLSMNLPQALLALAPAPVDPDALLTAPALADLLGELARSPTLSPHVRCDHRVLRVTRHTWPRGENAGHPVRADMPFRLLVSGPQGETALEADVVLDASGTYGQPVPLVAVGVAFARDRTMRTLGALHERLEALAGRRVLLVGHGHSAANALGVLDALPDARRPSQVVWTVRTRNLRPCGTVPGDVLPERARVVDHANALAQRPPAWLRVERAADVLAFAPHDDALRVTLSAERSADVDFVIALIGYRPDLDVLSELPLEVSPATEGAAGLARALGNVADCLSVPKVAAADLASGEPRFYLIGTKSYGRAPTFLLQTGLAQLETILDGLLG